MMIEIKPLLLGFPGKVKRGFLGWSSSFLIRKTTSSSQVPKMILYDTGGMNERDKILHSLDDDGIAPDNIDIVVLSHLHFDHAANWTLFKNAELYIHPEEINPSEDYKDTARLDFHRENLLRHPKINFVEENDQIEGLDVIELPGHTPGLIGLLTSNGILVSDAVKNRSELEYGSLLNVWDKDLARQSIEKVKKLSDTIYPGHDVPVFKKGKEWVPLMSYQEKIQFPTGIVNSDGKADIHLDFITKKEDECHD